MNKEIILLNNKVKMLEERYIENRHDCKKLENWLIILGGAIVMLGILLAFQYIDNSKMEIIQVTPILFVSITI